MSKDAISNSTFTYMKSRMREIRTSGFVRGVVSNGYPYRVIITYKDRLSRAGFELFKYFFEKFGCEIVVISEVG